MYNNDVHNYYVITSTISVASNNFYHAIANATGIARRSVTEEQQATMQVPEKELQDSSNCTIIMSDSEEPQEEPSTLLVSREQVPQQHSFDYVITLDSDEGSDNMENGIPMALNLMMKMSMMSPLVNSQVLMISRALAMMTC